MFDIKANRESELREINRLAHELGYINGDDRSVYENLLGAYFEGVTSARDLKDHERVEWLVMLRLWRQGRKISNAAVEALERQRAEHMEGAGA